MQKIPSKPKPLVTMNDWSAAHYCGGGESGWTMYLDQSYTSQHGSGGSSGGGGGGRRGGGKSCREKEAKVRAEEDEDDEEEDLSMVSDASSGPPHYIEDNEECFYNNGYSSYAISASKSATKKSKHTYLDDTASSPVYAYAKANKINAASSKEALEKNAAEFSQGFSATHFKRKSALRKHFGFYGSQKSAPEE